jgi:AbrB family looped-hinge helix DNA binding protein
MSDKFINVRIPDKGKVNKIMETVTVTAKGQITIPADLRRKLDIAEGEQLVIVCEGETLKLIPIPKLSKLAGVDKEIFKQRKPSKEIEKMRKEWDDDFEKRAKET